MFPPVIVLGAGGHAKVVIETLSQAGHQIIGVVAPDYPAGNQFCGYKVLGGDDAISTYSAGSIVLANGIGVLPGQHQRWRIAALLREQGYSFVTIVHPSAIVANDVILAEGVQVMAGAIIQPGSRIGQDTIINTGARIDHDCSIAANCHVAPGVVCSGGVALGEGGYLGTGAVLIQNVCVGEHSVVAAGSVIYKDVSANVTFIQARRSKEINER